MKRRALTKTIRQTGTSDTLRDNELRAEAPGKRRAESGNIYYEYRKNRTDVKGRDTPKRIIKVRDHTRNEGEVPVIEHDRKIEVSRGSDKSSIKKPIDDSQEYRGYWINHNYQGYHVKKNKDAKTNYAWHYNLQNAKDWIDNKLKKPDEQNKVKVGDIFETSWGYDQTNYDYLVVISISSTEKTCICQMSKHNDVGYSGQSHIQRPNGNGYGKTFPMRIEYRNGEPQLRGSYYYSSSQSSTRLDTFFKVKPGQTFYETDSQFGH